jgi:Arc/MetJ-type ribon-helix-helix transcriptional regulator
MPRDLMTIRLDSSQRRRLAAMARRRNRSVSELARSAIQSWLDAEAGKIAPVAAIEELIGSLAGGAPGRSTSSAYLGPPSRATRRPTGPRRPPSVRRKR